MLKTKIKQIIIYILCIPLIYYLMAYWYDTFKEVWFNSTEMNVGNLVILTAFAIMLFLGMYGLAAFLVKKPKKLSGP